MLTRLYRIWPPVDNGAAGFRRVMHSLLSVQGLPGTSRSEATRTRHGISQSASSPVSHRSKQVTLLARQLMVSLPQTDQRNYHLATSEDILNESRSTNLLLHLGHTLPPSELACRWSRNRDPQKQALRKAVVMSSLRVAQRMFATSTACLHPYYRPCLLAVICWPDTVQQRPVSAP